MPATKFKQKIESSAANDLSSSDEGIPFVGSDDKHVSGSPLN